MDIDFDTIIYIIILALSALGGIYKNYVKKKNAEREMQPASSSNQEFEYDSPSASNSDYGAPEPQQTMTPFEEFMRRQLDVSNTVEETVHEPEEINERFDSDREGVAVFANTDNALLSDDTAKSTIEFSGGIQDIQEFNYDEIANGEISDHSEIIHEFDIKKAVIYSEILKRPKY